MQKLCRAHFWAQPLTRGLELNITTLPYLVGTYLIPTHAVNNVGNCSDNVCIVQDPLKSGTDLSYLGWALYNLGRILFGIT